MDRWWREHRPTTANLFSRELQTALRSIAHVPELGAHCAERKGMRRGTLGAALVLAAACGGSTTGLSPKGDASVSDASAESASA
jgi:hypothetical protein